jgi:hypothetical protein
MKEEIFGLKELDTVYLESKLNKKPLAKLIKIETNESREKRGLKPIKTRFKVVEPEESFFSKIFEGTVIAGGMADGEIVEMVECFQSADGLLEQHVKITKR